jgi:hypothetical protein
MNERWSPKKVARYLGVSPDTLRRWRREGRGPAWHKINDRDIRYDSGDVVGWSYDRDVEAARPSAATLTKLAKRGADQARKELAVTSEDLVSRALAEAAIEAQRRSQQQTQQKISDPLAAHMAPCRAAVGAVLGVDHDGPMRAVMQGAEPLELEFDIERLRFIWDCVGRALYYVAVDDNRYLLRSRADLGRAIEDERTANGDLMNRPTGDLTTLFKANPRNY